MKSAIPALLLAASLTGCATSWVVDSDVKSFSSIGAVAPGATYRFDRLPSQQADGARQESLEAMAMILPHGSSGVPRDPKLETNRPVSRKNGDGKSVEGSQPLEPAPLGVVSSPATLGLYVWAGYARDEVSAPLQ